MGWDVNFMSENKIFSQQNQSTGKIFSENKKIRQCSGCDQPLGIVSTILYTIDEMPYCSTCYSQMIGNRALERDHSEIMQEKQALR